MYDVVVVGAGPSGSAAARYCAEYGLKTLCIEEHGTIGHPVQCAGLLSVAAFEACRVPDSCIVNRVQGARIYASDGSNLFFDAKETKGCVVDRGMLDRTMAEAAIRAGVELRLKTYVRGIHRTEIFTTGIRGSETISARMIIAADGFRSKVARIHGMVRPPILLGGLQAEILHDMDLRYVEIYPHASNDFFGWIIPVDQHRARIGLCSETKVREKFSKFMEQFQAPCTHFVSGAIPIGMMPATYGKRTLFVGDAAGMVKPTSGGGIYMGVRAAKHAAFIAEKCVETDSFGDQMLRQYEIQWRRDFGRELSLGFRIFQLRRTMSPQEIDEIIQTLQDPSIIDEIIQKGDMDRPSKILLTLVKNPSILNIARILFRKGVMKILKE